MTPLCSHWLSACMILLSLPSQRWTYPTHFRSQGVMGLGICTCSRAPLFSGLRTRTSQDSGSREWPAFHPWSQCFCSPRVLPHGLGPSFLPPFFVDRSLLLFGVGRVASQLRCVKEGLLSWGLFLGIPWMVPFSVPTTGGPWKAVLLEYVMPRLVSPPPRDSHMAFSDVSIIFHSEKHYCQPCPL